MEYNASCGTVPSREPSSNNQCTNSLSSSVTKYFKKTISDAIIGKIYYHVTYAKDAIFSEEYNCWNEPPEIVYALLEPILRSKIRVITGIGGYVHLSGIKPGVYKRFFDKKNFVIVSIRQKSFNPITYYDVIQPGCGAQTSEYIIYDIWMVGPQYRYYFNKCFVKSLKLNKAVANYFIRHSANDIIIDRFGYASKIKAMEDIILDQSIKKTLANELRAFMNQKKYYEKNHIKYKFGMIFHGSPGTGKTSLAYAMVKYLNCSYSLIDEMDFVRYVEYQRAKKRREAGPYNPFEFSRYEKYHIFIIDEFDSIIKNIGKREKSSKNKNTQEEATFGREASMLSKRQLLDALDNGFPDGSIIIATTNDYEYLLSVDKAFIRPGRFDLHLELDTFDKDRAMKMIIQRGLDEEFANSIEYPVVPSKLEYLINQELYARGEKLKEGHE